jgi:hypothetical protein
VLEPVRGRENVKSMVGVMTEPALVPLSLALTTNSIRDAEEGSRSAPSMARSPFGSEGPFGDVMAS